MGLFSKKEECPVCGGEVKGLFLVKIADKKTLCKQCSEQFSMNEELQKMATPEFARAHLSYRKQNAQKYAAAFWDREYTVPGLRAGVDLTSRLIYLVHDDMNDKENPVIFSFDQLTRYELYRLKKKVDSADMEGETKLETGLTAVAAVTEFVKMGDSNATDYFVLKLTTTEPYWENIELKMRFTRSQLHGPFGFYREMQDFCQMIKQIVRREPVCI